MKKHRDSDVLAQRFREAAAKPPGLTTSPAPVEPPPAPKEVEVVKAAAAPEPEPVEQMPVKAEEEPRAAKKTGKREARKKPANDDTVPISLRPPRATLQRYVMAAANRTQTVGRVVSVQEMILEVMERAL